MFAAKIRAHARCFGLEIKSNSDVLKTLDNFFKTRIMVPTDIEALSVHATDSAGVLHNEIARAIAKGWAAAKKVSHLHIPSGIK